MTPFTESGVVGRFLGDGDVVRVAFRHAAGRDAGELGLLQGIEVLGAAVAHAGAETAHELVHGFGEGALVRNPAHDAFRDQFLHFHLVVLEVAVLGAGRHRVDGAHAAVGLELTAAVDDGLARGFLGAGEHGAAHHAVSAGRKGLDDIAGVAQAAIGNQRRARALDGLVGVVDGAELGNAHARDDTGGADGARADAHFHAVGAGLDQVTRAFLGGNVAHHHVQRRVRGLHALEEVDDALAVSMRGIQHDGIHAFGVQGGHAVQGVRRNADARRHAETALLVLAGFRMQTLLDQVLIGDQADDAALRVHHGKFLHLVLLEDGLHVFAVRAGVRNGDQVLRRHDGTDRNGHVLEEADVPVRDDAHEMLLAVRHGDAADVVLPHQAQSLAHRLVLVDGHGVGDHAVLGTLDLPDLGRLGGDAHIFMNHADASFPCQGDGHRRFGDGVHSGGHNRDVQLDVAGKASMQADFPRKDFGVRRDEQYVVKSEAFQGYSLINKRHRKQIFAKVVIFRRLQKSAGNFFLKSERRVGSAGGGLEVETAVVAGPGVQGAGGLVLDREGLAEDADLLHVAPGADRADLLPGTSGEAVDLRLDHPLPARGDHQFGRSVVREIMRADERVARRRVLQQYLVAADDAVTGHVHRRSREQGQGAGVAEIIHGKADDEGLRFHIPVRTHLRGRDERKEKGGKGYQFSHNAKILLFSYLCIRRTNLTSYGHPY